MPIKRVSGGYKWGNSGKVYPTRAGAERQMAAAYANGYEGEKSNAKKTTKAKKQTKKPNRKRPKNT